MGYVNSFYLYSRLYDRVPMKSGLRQLLSLFPQNLAPKLFADMNLNTEVTCFHFVVAIYFGLDEPVRTTRDAKEYLIGRISAQADEDGVPLSDIERKMLYFSETDWTLPNMTVVSEDFSRNYNEKEYEAKVREPIQHVRNDASGKYGDDGWNEAVKRLRGEDHYLLVLIDERYNVAAKRPSGDIVRLMLASVLVSAVCIGSTFIVYAHVANVIIAKAILLALLAAAAMAVTFLFNRR